MRKLRFNSLENKSEEEIGKVLDDFCKPLTIEEEQESLELLNSEILEFERKYNVKSEDLKAALENKKIQETADICSWLIAIDCRNKVLTKA